MADMTRRDDLLRVVHRGLVHRDFAERFAPVGDAGERTIVVTLPEDSIHELCVRVRKSGGSANVVTPHVDGLLVFTMKLHANNEAPDYIPSTVTADKTVAEVVQRLVSEGGAASFMICSSKSESSQVDSPRILQLT